MCKEDTIVIRTYIFIYSFWKIVFLFLIFILVPYSTVSFISLFSWRSTSNSTRIFPFEWNRIYHLCLFHSFVYSSSVYLLSVFFYHWIHPTLVFCERGCTVLPWRRAGGVGECWFVGEVPREVFINIVRWKPHSSTSGCLTEGDVAGQLTMEWCSKPRLQATAWPVRLYLPVLFVLLTLNITVFLTVVLSYRKCPCIYSFWYLLHFPNLEFIWEIALHIAFGIPHFIGALRKNLKS